MICSKTNCFTWQIFYFNKYIIIIIIIITVCYVIYVYYLFSRSFNFWFVTWCIFLYVPVLFQSLTLRKFWQH